MVLMKRDNDDGYSDDVYWKRDFSADQRRSAASHGDALPDGSFPIKNKEDLANARRLVGHAKDPAAARALIRRRAKELGVSIDDDKDAKKGLMNIFRGFLEGATPKEVHKTLESFDLENITMDNTVKIEMTDDIKKMIDGKVEEVRKDLVEKLAKAEEELATLKAKGGKDGFDGDDDDDDGKDGKGKMKKSETSILDLPEDIQKALNRAQANEIILKQLMDERESQAYAKEATSLGLEEVHGETLRKAFSGDKAGVAELKKLMKGMSEQIRTGKVFAEFGSSRNGNGSDTAADEIKLAAEDYRKGQVAAARSLRAGAHGGLYRS
jgi:hypothetical protein